MGFDREVLSEDRFLGGQLTILQPRKGYRAGVDPVFLAAAIPALSGQSVLDLGCGAGVAGLCVARRVASVALTGVEVQPDYADLARENALRNGIAIDVVTADLRALPANLRSRSFDHVIANPPYFDRAHGSSAADSGRDTALAGDTPIFDWLMVAAKRLAPKGHLTVIQKADRLHDLLRHLPPQLGSVHVLPLAARSGRPAELVILQARKGGRGTFRLQAPVVLHDGPIHERDEDSYSPLARSILRDGAALPVGH